MRTSLTVLACAALAACSPAIPESGAPYQSYSDYRKQQIARDAQLTGSALPPPDAVSSEPISTAQPTTVYTNNPAPTYTPAATPAPANDAASIAADATAALQTTQVAQTSLDAQANSGQPVVYADPSNPAPATVSNATGISTENDFDAVGAQRSIEDDAALIAQNRAQYKVIQPTALPTRGGSGGPNIVEYALSSNHAPGAKVYRRSGFGSQKKYQRNCAKYASADQAQVDFLAKGGPSRDKMGLDPDGDGFACGWDPRPFRYAVNSGSGT